MRTSGAPSTRMRPAVGSYSLHSSLTSVVLPAPFSPTSATTVPAGSVEVDGVEHEAVGAGIGERDALEADALAQPRGRGLVGRGHERRRVVLEPGQAPRAVEPDAAQEADLAHGRADVGREPRARGEHEQHVARRRAQARRHEDDRADVGAAEDRPGQRVPDGARPAGGRHGPVPALPGLAPLPDEALADAGDAHLLARRARWWRSRTGAGPGGRRRRRAPRRRARRPAASSR